MKVQTLLQTHQKVALVKPTYKKPVYKTYKELLQLDRPKHIASYESDNQNDDFLEKLLMEEKKKQKQKIKKKLSRKSAGKSQNKPTPTDKPRIVSPNRQQNQVNPQKYSSNKIQQNLKEIEQVNETQQILQSTSKIIKEPNGSKSMGTLIKVRRSQKTLSNDRSKSNNVMLIDQKSKQLVPPVYLSAQHMLHSSLGLKKQVAYNELLKEKLSYQRIYKPSRKAQATIQEQKILHQIDKQAQSKFSYAPNIDPLYQNWRYNLTFGPNLNINKHDFIDRRSLFRSHQQQLKFVQSLRQLSSFKR